MIRWTMVLLLVLSGRVFAQAPGNMDCRTAAQVWYDAVDADAMQARYGALLVALQQQNTDRVSRGMADAIAVLAEMNAIPYPECIADAHQHLDAGWRGLITAIFALQYETWVSFSVNNAIAFQQIGLARGYLDALGVTLEDLPPGSNLYYK